MSTGLHVDPATLGAVDLDDEDDESDIPAGAVRFVLEPAEIEDALAAESAEVRIHPSPRHFCPHTWRDAQTAAMHLAGYQAYMHALLQLRAISILSPA